MRQPAHLQHLSACVRHSEPLTQDVKAGTERPPGYIAPSGSPRPTDGGRICEKHVLPVGTVYDFVAIGSGIGLAQQARMPIVGAGARRPPPPASAYQRACCEETCRDRPSTLSRGFCMWLLCTSSTWCLGRARWRSRHAAHVLRLRRISARTLR